MPDTFTHIAIPLIFHKYFKPPLIWSIILIGTVVPDYLRQFTALILPPAYHSAYFPFHSIVGAFFSSLLLTSFFIKNIRKYVFISFFTGQIIHLIFDMLQTFLCVGRLYLFFPFMKSIDIGFFSESYWLQIFIFSFTAFLVYCSAMYTARRAARIKLITKNTKEAQSSQREN